MNLKEIRKLIEQATPGPWEVNGSVLNFPCHKSPSGWDSAALEIDNCDGRCFSTADFIAASRTLMPKLLAVVDLVKGFSCCCGGVGCTQDRELQTALAALEANE